jgi:eukaryotic-like serine/threonine-protein kinase
VSGDPEFLSRFEREANAVAALTHPNILSIFDFGSQDGIAFAVIELLEGKTLREKLDEGPISQRKAVDWAQQVARGLSAAHERGVVHRDLKPENLFVTKDGHVKILDFGLAKNVGKAVPGKQTSAPTVSGHTLPGTVMGTVGYMSPEQVRGLSADHRSDIFCLGAVLYEMLAGRRAFSGATAADTMSAILNAEPPELSGSGRKISPALDRIARHCLEKNAEERFQSARDLAFALESVSQTSGEQSAAAAPRGKLPSAALLGAAALLLGAGLNWVGTRARSEEKPATFRRITFRRGDVADARFTPDGDNVVYSAAFDGGPMEVYLTRWDGHDARPLGMLGMQLAAVSRTGELAVVREQGGVSTLSRISLAGSGTPRDVLAGVTAAAWGPDGELAVVRESADEQQLEYPIGRVIVRIPGTRIYSPRVSPRGDRIAFHIHFPTGGPEIRVADLKGKMVTLIKSFGVGHPVWSPDGKEVFFSADVSPGNSSIHAATLGGRLRTVLANSQEFEMQDISRDGKVLVHDNLPRGALIFGDLQNGRVRDLSWLDGTMLEDLSADGGRILFSEQVHGQSSGGDVFVRRNDGSPAVRLGEGEALTLSPDGEWVATLSGERPRKLVLLPTGAGEAKTVPLGDIEAVDATFVPGSRRITVFGAKPGVGNRIFLMDWEGRDVRVLGPEDPGGSLISPDGKRAVIRSAKSGRQIWSLDGGAPPTDLPGIGPTEMVIQWSEDGRFLILRSLFVLPVQLSRYEIATGRRTVWQKLEPVDLAGVSGLERVLVSRDGRYYAYSYWTKTKSDLYVIDGLQARLW